MLCSVVTKTTTRSVLTTCLHSTPFFPSVLLSFASLYDYLSLFPTTGRQNGRFWTENVPLFAGDCTKLFIMYTEAVCACVCADARLCVYSCTKPKRLLSVMQLDYSGGDLLFSV